MARPRHVACCSTVAGSGGKRSLSALFGLTNHIINQEQCTILVTAVIGSAVVPTLIAQIWFQPHFEPLEEDA